MVAQIIALRSRTDDDEFATKRGRQVGFAGQTELVLLKKLLNRCACEAGIIASLNCGEYHGTWVTGDFVRAYKTGREEADMVLTVDLTPDEARRLAVLAVREGRTVADVAHDALVQFVEEDVADEEWAAEVVAEWDASDKKTRPVSELRAELGL